MKTASAAFPSFYEPSKVGEFYFPRMDLVVEEALKARPLFPIPASKDDPQVLLIIIDGEIHFVLENMPLTVPGAVDDCRRLIEFIYTYPHKISRIWASLDLHLPYMIHTMLWWKDANGNHPAPFTNISLADVQSGKWQPIMKAAWSIKYLEQLAGRGRYDLTVWPFHTPLAHPGSALVPALYEAILWHSVVRYAQPWFIDKGLEPESENYSIAELEVPIPNRPNANIRAEFFDSIVRFRKIYVAGWAKTHCFLWTVRSLFERFKSQPDVLRQFFFLMDATSPIPIPALMASTDAELATMEQAGINMVKTTDSWK